VVSQKTTINHGQVRTEYLWLSPRTAADLGLQLENAA
jgi:hypothetical protein